MARLRRTAHRLVWLNPLAADPAYEPLTRGHAGRPPPHRPPAARQLDRLARGARRPDGDDRMKDVLADLDAWAPMRASRSRRWSTSSAPRRGRRAPRWRSTSAARSPARCRGGCVEGAVVEVAREVLAGGAAAAASATASSTRRRGTSACRAAARSRVWIQADPHREFAELARADGRGALVTDLASPGGAGC